MKLLLLLSSALLAAGTFTSAFAATENFDANFLPVRHAGLSKPAMIDVAKPNTLLKKYGNLIHYAENLERPTFIWAVGQTNVQDQQLLAYRKDEAAPAVLARGYLKQQATLLQVGPRAIESAHLRAISKLDGGASIIEFGQRVDGYEVFGRSLNVLLGENGQLVATSGYFAPAKQVLVRQNANAKQNASGFVFELQPQEAISTALADLGGTLPAGVFSLQHQQGDYSYYTTAAVGVTSKLLRPARIKQVLFPLHGDLVPAYYIELFRRDQLGQQLYYAYVVSAESGRLLFRKNLIAHAAFEYRVSADTTTFYPYESPRGDAVLPIPGNDPDFTPTGYPAASLVTVDSLFGVSTPWLTTGATTLTGPNVEVYADIVEPTGFNEGDYRTSLKPASSNSFDYSFDPALQPAEGENRDAAMVNMFYVINFLHDSYHIHGFNDPDRVAEGGDHVLAEAQDFGGMNNANMGTPADGTSPTMQMYLWDGPAGTGIEPYVEILSPADIAGKYDVGTAAFGPEQADIQSTAVVGYEDSTGTTNDACEAATNGADLSGNIALILRGDCEFSAKVYNAQQAGAIAAIIVNDALDSDPTRGGIISMSAGANANQVTIPSLFLKNSDGAPIISAEQAGDSVTADMFQELIINRDGGLDTGIVAHEYFHYVSNRLIGNGSGLVNHQGGSMGEGWSDMAALLLMSRPGDDPTGAYAAGYYAISNPYFGVRRYPYSTDMAINPLTFKHIEAGVDIVSTAPVAHPAYLSGDFNAEVHSAGEVWASALWEGYVNLWLHYGSVDQARDKMLNYIIGGLKMTPTAPTFTEARDAILSVALAVDGTGTDFDLLAQGFAKRGMGAGAVSPPRFSTSHAGVVESFTATGGAYSVTEASIEPEATGASDGDGIWDPGEEATIILEVRNTGWADITNADVQVVLPPNVSVTGGGSNVQTIDLAAFATGSATTFEREEKILTFNLTLNGPLAPQQPIDITVEFPDVTADPAAVDEPDDVTFDLNTNFDLEVTRSNDDMESSAASEFDWATTLQADDPALAEAWRVADSVALGFDPKANMGNVWYGADNGTTSDSILTMPTIQVSTTQDFSISFYHSYQFEADESFNNDGSVNLAESTYFDGAVVEISTDGGTTWQDVTDANGNFDTGYNGQLTGTGAGNILEGRNAFVGSGEGMETISFGSALAGETVKLRFRIGTDEAAGDFGWVIDDVTVAGAATVMFSTPVAEKGTAGDTDPVADAGVDQTVDASVNVTLDGTGSSSDAISYHWAQLEGTTVTLSGANSAQASFNAPSTPQRLLFKLTVADSAGQQDSDTVVVTIPGQPPVANAGANETVDTNTTVTLHGGGSTDPEGETLYYSWLQISGSAVMLSDADIAQPTFTSPLLEDSLVFELTVTDALGNTDKDSVTITVKESAPTNTNPDSNGGGDGGGSIGFAWLFVLSGLALLRRRKVSA